MFPQRAFRSPLRSAGVSCHLCVPVPSQILESFRDWKDFCQHMVVSSKLDTGAEWCRDFSWSPTALPPPVVSPHHRPMCLEPSLDLRSDPSIPFLVAACVRIPENTSDPGS